MISFVAVFVACWLHRQVYILWYHYDTGQFNMFWHIFKIAALCLSYTNSCLNPFALYLLSRQFRDHYDRLLFSRLKFNSGGDGRRVPHYEKNSDKSVARVDATVASSSRHAHRGEHLSETMRTTNSSRCSPYRSALAMTERVAWDGAESAGVMA